MEEKKKKNRIQFLFLIPALVIFCAYFLPLAGISSYTVFRGKELWELYLQFIEYAPPAEGYGLLVSLFRLVPFVALVTVVISLLGWKETAYLSIILSVFCLILTLGLVGPGYTPLVSIANPAELGLPLPHPGFIALISEG